MKSNFILILLLILSMNLLKASEITSIQNFDVKPENSPAINKINLQKAIDWASLSGSALLVEPSEVPYAIEGRDACLVLKYPKGTRTLSLRYGISFVDEDQARQNMEREVDGKTVAELQSTGRDIWNEALGKINIEGGTADEQTVFYTSFYRCYERPVCISEDGRYYSPFDGKVHEDQGRPFFTDDWIWDSYRAHHPLRILIDSEMEEDILHSFVLMAEQMDNLWMPTFPKITGDSRSMNSNHGIATVLDACRKRLKNFDLEKAYEASKGAITEKTLAPWSDKPDGELDRFYKEYGYFPALREGEQETIPEVHPFERRQPVAVTLGTSYDEWCLSQIAEELGKTDEAGLEEETIVIYTSDHGDFVGNHRMVEKAAAGQNVYEDILNIPLIIKYPGKINKGQRTAELVTPADILPTLIDILETPGFKYPIQGESMSDVILNNGSMNREYLV